jgi:6-phosphofructokinase 1
VFNKKICILTSGGDCSGLNAVIRAAFIKATSLGYEVLGSKRGVQGLGEESGEIVVLDDSVCDESMLTRSGSVLLGNTRRIKNREGELCSKEEEADLFAKAYKKFGLSGVVFIGGDGSIEAIGNIMKFHKDACLNIAIVPKTIDNDVSFTDIAIGFSTVIEVVSESIENIRTTAMSHERVMVVEVMGRDAGFIALHSGIASGADVIIIPEFKCDDEKLLAKIKASYKRKGYCIVVVAEAAEIGDFKHGEVEIDKVTRIKYLGIGDHVVSFIQNGGFDSRLVRLGHIQRGGKTSVADRIIGSGFGIEAVSAIHKNSGVVMMAYSGGKIVSIPAEKIIGSITRNIGKDDIHLKIATELGIYVGET